jgi:CRISPR/Cas system CMR subunit Cmr6 (Cas7 group RAMP superfamily)
MPDFSSASPKIAEISQELNARIEKFNELKEKYVNKINKVIDEIESTINEGIRYIKSGAKKLSQAIEIRINKLNAKLDKICKALMDKIEKFIKDICEWYDSVMLKIKKGVVKGVLAKMDIDCDDPTAIELAKMIPHPSIEGLMPSINLSIEIPDISSMVNADFLQEIKLQRIEI